MSITDPIELAAELEAYYRRIGARSMRDLPIYNEALDVEAIGFQVENEVITGILVTPWFMNLMLLPRDGTLAQRAPGSSFGYALPAGLFDFNVGDVEGIGRIASCSLFSPMFEFTEIATARATAEAALAEIMTPEPTRPQVSAIDRRSLLRGTLTEPRP